MEFFKFKDAIRSWSNWVLAGVVVTPVLNETVQPIANLLPESWKPWFITGLGVVGLIVDKLNKNKGGKNV